MNKQLAVFLLVFLSWPVAAFSGMYQDFPHFKQDGEYMEIDAIAATSIEQHPLLGFDTDQQQLYFQAPGFGQIPVLVPADLQVNCPGLVRLKGKGEFVDLGGEPGTKQSYSRQSLTLEDFECLDFLSPEKWFEFEVVDGHFKGFVVNPFPTAQPFHIEISSPYRGDSGNLKEFNSPLEPGDEQRYDIPLNCSQCLDEINNWNFIRVNILFDEDYAIFNQYIDVNFTPVECPVNPGTRT